MPDAALESSKTWEGEEDVAELKTRPTDASVDSFLARSLTLGAMAPSPRPSPPRILVTGATGTIGSELIELLAVKGVPVRALSRRASPRPSPPGVEWAVADLAEPSAALAEAFRGIDRLFLLTSNGDDMVRLQKDALRLARESGVAHVVKLSALGASDHSQSLIGLWHWVVEQAIESSPLAWTFLRPHHFMQNLLDQRRSIIEEGVVRSAAGEGRIPFVDTRDVAAVAAVALTEPGHAGRTYVLTGREAISYRQAAEVLSAAIDRPLRYQAETPAEARERLSAAGLSESLVSAQLAIAAYQRAEGATARTTTTIQDVTGRPPRSFSDFARDHADGFRA